MANRGPILMFSFAVACGDGKSHEPVAEDDLLPAIADEVCAQQAHCGCDMPLTADDCRMALEQAFMMFIMPSQDAGLTYDAECGGEAVGLYDEIGCKTIEDALDTGACRPCKLYYGSKGAGQACTKLQDMVYDDCGPGLVCDGMVCVDPCSRAGEGEPCLGRRCADGLVCNASVDMMGMIMSACERVAALGESCAELSCDEKLVCDDTMKCARPPGVGEPCVGFCDETAWCDTAGADPMQWVCRAPKADGEACMGGNECASTSCDDMTMTCAPVEPFVCQIGG